MLATRSVKQGKSLLSLLGFILGSYIGLVLIAFLIDPLMAMIVGFPVFWPFLFDGIVKFTDFLAPVLLIVSVAWIATCLVLIRLEKVGFVSALCTIIGMFVVFIIAGDVRASQQMQSVAKELGAKCFESRSFLASVLDLENGRNWHARLRLDTGTVYIWSYKYMNFDIAPSGFDRARVVCNEHL